MDLNRLPSLGSSSKYVEGNSSQTSCNPDYFDIAPARVVYSSSTSEPLNFEPGNWYPKPKTKELLLNVTTHMTIRAISPTRRSTL